MGYSATAPLASLFDVDREVNDLLRRIAERVQRRWLELARDFTPIAVVHADDREGRGREPGTLKRRWRTVGGVIMVGEGRFRAEIENWDSKAGFVEYPTAPHIIRAKPGHALRFRVGEEVVYAAHVNHPGTHGSFMLARSAAVIVGELPGIVEEESRP